MPIKKAGEPSDSRSGFDLSKPLNRAIIARELGSDFLDYMDTVRLGKAGKIRLPPAEIGLIISEAELNKRVMMAHTPDQEISDQAIKFTSGNIEAGFIQVLFDKLGTELKTDRIPHANLVMISPEFGVIQRSDGKFNFVVISKVLNNIEREPAIIALGPEVTEYLRTVDYGKAAFTTAGLDLTDTNVSRVLFTSICVIDGEAKLKLVYRDSLKR